MLGVLQQEAIHSVITSNHCHPGCPHTMTQCEKHTASNKHWGEKAWVWG